MKIYNIVFSATGRTERIADIFCGRLSEENEKIDISDRELDCASYSFGPEDVCVVSVPVYEGRVPKPAAEKLAKFNGGGAKAVLIAVFGNRAIDDCLLEMYDILSRRGFACAAGIEAVAQHSIMPKYGSDRPDEADIAQLKSYAEKIKEILDSGREFAPLSLPGARPYKEMGGIPFKPSANKKCVSCGLCAKKCPAGAIPADNPKITDKSKCITCMRCVEICPTDARDLPPILVKAAGLAMGKRLSGRKENKLYTAQLI